MAGFVRRFAAFPPTSVITEIEGVVIVDLPPPAPITGVGTGTVAIVGEFADMGLGVAVNAATGVVTTDPRPTEIFSSQDYANKLGGFDSTIGETGAGGGSGFIATRNKRFTRLVAVPVNLASAVGARVWRQLATSAGAADPLPVVPITAATVAAAREFLDSGDRVKLGTSHEFTAVGEYVTGVDGSVTATAPAVTQIFTSAGSSFLTAKGGNRPVEKGDLIVVGQIGGAAGLGANADTYRVVADATLDTQLTLEKLDGASFDWTTIGSLPFRVHQSSDGDSGPQQALAGAPGYILPARPVDAVIAAGTTLSPTTVPPAGTATTWDPLSGLKMQTDPTTGLAYTATVQAENAANDATIDALYDSAVDGLLGEESPARDVNIVYSARHSSTINAKLRAHALAAAQLGVGRMAVISPELDEQVPSTIQGDAAPGVGATRAERVVYDWPGLRTSIPEAVGVDMGTADGFTTDDGILDVTSDGWMVSILSNLASERNPGQAADPVRTIMATVLGIQRGVTGLTIDNYKAFRRLGIAAPRIDRSSGPIFQSGITSSLVSGEKNINRRRMADEIEDSLALALTDFSKLPLTDALKDSMLAEVRAFMVGLESPNNPPAQRISGFTTDDASGNTPELEAAGVHVIIVRARTLATADFIVLQVEAGEGVNVTVTAI